VGAFSALSIGADAGQAALTLDEAISLALAQNDRLGVADAGVAEAEAGIQGAKSSRLPQLGLDASFSRTTNPTLVFSNKLGQGDLTAADLDLDALNDPDALNNFQGLFSIHQPIYTGGATRGQLDGATAEHQAAIAGRERTRQEVVGQVIGAYTDAILAGNQLDVARESLATARANVKLVTDLREAGLVVESDLLQARVRETEVHELVARSESAVEISRAALNMAMGRDLDTPIDLPGSVTVTTAQEEALDDLILDALAHRPDLRAGRDHLRASENGMRSARSGHRPDVGVTGLAEANSAELTGNYGTNWSVFVGARFKLFDGKRTNTRVRQAAERRNRARLENELLERSIDLEVRKAFYDRVTARKRLEQATAAVDMARESLRMVQDRYGEGLTTLVELLESETRLTRAQTRDVAAKRDVLLAQAQLDLAVGRL
jgi:outer membrane protein TolC